MSAEQSLLDAAKDYVDGLIANIAVAQQNNGILDPISLSVLQNVSKSIPGAAQAYALASQVVSAVDQVAGQGSTLGRAVQAAFSGNALTTPYNVAKAIFGGRTYQSDNYWAAVFYRYYVLGQKITDPNQCSDADVIVALKWFEDKLGVFISGREHLKALQSSPQAYINLYGVNSYTTTDTQRVLNAYNVMKTYMPVDAIGTVLAGAWANAVGVFDNLLVQLANQGSVYAQQQLQLAKQGYVASAGTSIPQPILPGIDDDTLFIIAGAVVLLIIIIVSAQ